jgi:hypothetical protein
MAPKIQRWLLNFLKLCGTLPGMTILDISIAMLLSVLLLPSKVSSEKHDLFTTVFFRKELVRFEVSSAVLLRIQVFGNVMQCCCQH